MWEGAPWRWLLDGGGSTPAPPSLPVVLSDRSRPTVRIVDRSRTAIDLRDRRVETT